MGRGPAPVRNKVHSGLQSSDMNMPFRLKLQAYCKIRVKSMTIIVYWISRLLPYRIWLIICMIILQTYSIGYIKWFYISMGVGWGIWGCPGGPCDPEFWHDWTLGPRSLTNPALVHSLNFITHDVTKSLPLSPRRDVLGYPNSSNSSHPIGIISFNQT